MVGQQVLALPVQVRVLAPQPEVFCLVSIGGRSNHFSRLQSG